MIAISEKSTPARLLSAAIHLELGNFSLAANHYRLAGQDPNNLNTCRVGILACYLGLKDNARAASLAEELQTEISEFSPELEAFFEEQLVTLRSR